MLHLLFFPAPCWKFDFAEIKTNRVFERKEERVYKDLHLGDTLTSPALLAWPLLRLTSYIPVFLLNFVKKINSRHFFGGRSHAENLQNWMIDRRSIPDGCQRLKTSWPLSRLRKFWRNDLVPRIGSSLSISSKQNGDSNRETLKQKKVTKLRHEVFESAEEGNLISNED